METITLCPGELSIVVSCLNNIAGMAWTCDDEEAIIISFRKVNHFLTAHANCCKFKISVNMFGDFPNRKEMVFRFKLGDFRKFVKRICSNYNDLDGKVFIKLNHSSIQVTMPSMIGLNLWESPIGCEDWSER